MRYAAGIACAVVALAAPASAVADDLAERAMPSAGAYPIGVASGPDGALWVAENGAGRIARVVPGGAATEIALPAGARPVAIVVGPDGALWLTDAGRLALGRVTTGGTYTEHPLPPGAPPVGLAAGPDGRLWYTRSQGGDDDGGAVGAMATDGTVAEIARPGSAPRGIAAGPDGALWIAESRAGRIARVTTAGTVDQFALPDPAGRPAEIA